MLTIKTVLLLEFQQENMTRQHPPYQEEAGLGRIYP
jgi:hypothetical protein